MALDPIVIIGASHAGVQMAASARDAGWENEIVLLAEDALLPYHRPPLSKGLLTGKISVAEIPLRGESWYEKNNIVRLTGRRVTAVDRQRHRVILQGGEQIPYSRLGLATGARVRRLSLPGGKLDGVLYLRDFADVEKLKSQLRHTHSVVVIGGGFIGLEVASSLCKMGKKVTVLETFQRLMPRAVSSVISGWFGRRHTERGVNLIFNARVEMILNDGRGRAAGVLLSNGQKIAADLIVAGIGVTPAVELAKAADLTCSDGIVVDSLTRTSDPFIFAAGDVTNHPSVFSGGQLRLESVQNATDQAKVAGQMLAGIASIPYDGVPWFWSDQHDVPLQIVGLASSADNCVVRGDYAGGKFSVFSFSGRKLVCIESVDSSRDHVAGRKLLALTNARLTPEEAADPQFDLLAAARERS
ncbi:3-phenylpropionate/trans-cinnamate dioxygenase ferredoxin reductase subunit [Afipia massiliensis]|uniref:3-phenylpropionate/trans-cinnamate dioxygenase ferredoxin reductase subunit n=1 Tax=Afipia massiliensis TaxID=211460 RepID=A0A840N2Z7_9BRAD|nr:FAD-dependent oxidoreductase [Afipia massiliensis]MBB5052907.1 3-phenylpropionate/trans-cinnamate dioxygenase ferredoxin reductase subunit [Afipia massiliensis]